MQIHTLKGLSGLEEDCLIYVKECGRSVQSSAGMLRIRRPRKNNIQVKRREGGHTHESSSWQRSVRGWFTCFTARQAARLVRDATIKRKKKKRSVFYGPRWRRPKERFILVKPSPYQLSWISNETQSLVSVPPVVWLTSHYVAGKLEEDFQVKTTPFRWIFH